MISTLAKLLPIRSRIALLRTCGQQVLSVFLVLTCVLSGSLVQAQGKAPVEDRTPNRDALLDGQQRLDFARQYWRRAADEAGRAQAEAAEQARELANAQKRVNELRLLNEQAQKRLTAARASEAAAKKAYDSENAAFDRRVSPEPQPQSQPQQ